MSQLRIINQDQQKEFIRKHNKFVESHYQLGVWEQRILYGMIKQIKKSDEDFKEYTIYLNDLIQQYNLGKSKSTYNHIRNGVRTLMNNIITIETLNGEEVLETPIIIGMKNKKGEVPLDKAYVKLSFHPEMKPYLLKLENQYLLYDAANMFRLTDKPHSLRIYELLKQYEKLKKREFTVEELKEMLAIQNKYPKYANIKQKIIKPAQIHLATFTDIQFEFEEIKQSRRVHKLIFHIFKNENVKKVTPSADAIEVNTDLLEGIYTQVADWGVSKATISSWVEKYPIEHIQTAIAYVSKRQKDIKNLAGYLNEILKQERIVDGAEATKKNKQVQRAKSVKKSQEAIQVQAQIDQLHEEFGEKVSSLKREFLLSNPTVGKELFTQSKGNPLFPAKYKKASSTWENAYNENQIVRGIINGLLTDKFPTLIFAIENEYKQKLDKLNRLLE